MANRDAMIKKTHSIVTLLQVGNILPKTKLMLSYKNVFPNVLKKLFPSTCPHGVLGQAFISHRFHPIKQHMWLPIWLTTSKSPSTLSLVTIST